MFWSGAEILGLPPATMGEAASADCSDMLDRLEAREAARLSSTSPSSDSSENPRWCCAKGPGSRPVKNEHLERKKQGNVSPGVVWRETLLSFRNWSRKDIWEEGRSPSTEEETVIIDRSIFLSNPTTGRLVPCTVQAEGEEDRVETREKGGYRPKTHQTEASIQVLAGARQRNKGALQIKIWKFFSCGE